MFKVAIRLAMLVCIVGVAPSCSNATNLEAIKPPADIWDGRLGLSLLDPQHCEVESRIGAGTEVNIGGEQAVNLGGRGVTCQEANGIASELLYTSRVEGQVSTQNGDWHCLSGELDSRRDGYIGYCYHAFNDREFWIWQKNTINQGSGYPHSYLACGDVLDFLSFTGQMQPLGKFAYKHGDGIVNIDSAGSRTFLGTVPVFNDRGPVFFRASGNSITKISGEDYQKDIGTTTKNEFLEIDFVNHNCNERQF
jgi:hypothetical protein